MNPTREPTRFFRQTRGPVADRGTHYAVRPAMAGSDPFTTRERSMSRVARHELRWLAALAWCWLVLAPAMAEEGPLPARMMNVMPWGDDEQTRAVSVNTVYLTHGWTPENLRARLAEYGIDTLRVKWDARMLDAGLDSRWFRDIEALSDAGFKMVISCHTHEPNGGGRFQMYDSVNEGAIPVARRNPRNAPTWTRFIHDHRLIAEHFKDDPNILGYEPFNEYAPSSKTVRPGRLYLRDLGGWLDALMPLCVQSGKHVWIEGLRAGTTFDELEGQRDDRRRTLPELFAMYRGRIFPAIHMYNWYGPGYRRPENLNHVRDALANPRLPRALRPDLLAIAKEPDPARRQQRLHQYHFDQRYQAMVSLLDEARRVCGVDETTQVWLSEAGTGVKAWTGDARPDGFAATHFRAMIRAANARNVSVAFWLDRGTADGWGFFARDASAPADPRRLEYRRAFFETAADPLDFLRHPHDLSTFRP